MPEAGFKAFHYQRDDLQKRRASKGKQKILSVGPKCHAKHNHHCQQPNKAQQSEKLGITVSKKFNHKAPPRFYKTKRFFR